MASIATNETAAATTAEMQGFLQRVARRMLSGFPVVRRWEETEDISQQAASRLFVALQEVAPKSQRHLENLAATQIRRTLIDRARKYARSLEHGQGRWTPRHRRADVELVLQQSPDHLDEAAHLLKWTELHEAAGRMDVDLQEVFQLIWYRGLSRAAVAELLNSDVRTVQRKWRAAREYLADRLDQQLLEFL